MDYLLSYKLYVYSIFSGELTQLSSPSPQPRPKYVPHFLLYSNVKENKRKCPLKRLFPRTMQVNKTHIPSNSIFHCIFLCLQTNK